TGVPGMLDAALESHKPLIYGGAGNGPVFIERTADIPQAVKDIISSKTFDNGLLPAAEQSIVVDGEVADQVKQEFMKNHAWFMSSDESKQLARIMFEPDGSADKDLVGIPAEKLAQKAGFVVPKGTVLLISEEKFASHQNPYTREKLGPVVAYFIEDDWMHACEKCIELLLTERQGHTLVIHSRSEEVIREFALKKPVGRVLVNTPATFGSMGVTTNLVPAMTLGSGTAGFGITSDNVSPGNLIYVRKVGFGMRDMETADRDLFKRSTLPEQPHVTVEDMQHTEEVKTVQEVLRKIINNIEGLNDK
ncbi:MAG: acetaldehyde dehydrogenase, partial [Firmicutes bacterium]|nr:acetaldehyde dehydrogenase [Bacillota bacterium]